jgi:glycosyltransferase involved in cell wall biosynthesis
MKIGYVLNVFPKLSETFVINEMVELMQRRHEISIFPISRSNERIVQPEVNVYNLTAKAHYLPFASELVPTIASTVSSNAAAGRRPGLSAARRLYCVAAARFFSRIVRRLDLDIIHAHFANQSTYTAMLMSKYAQVPFTFTTHAIDIFDNPDVDSIKEKAEKASAIITISNFNRNYIHKLTGTSLERIHVVRACVLNRFRDFKRETPKGNRRRILSVARLVETKGIKYGILAVNKLTKRFPDIEYRIVGSGPLEAELDSLVESLDLENNVKMLGELDASVLADEFKKAGLFVLPCVRTATGDMDGIPVSLMEAMCLGIPAISTNISGIPELIEDGKSGLLVEEKNVGQLAEAIETLLQDESFASKIGGEGRKKVEESFNIHNEVGKLLRIWDEIRSPVRASR